MEDYYAILGVEPTVTNDEICNAHQHLVGLFEPVANETEEGEVMLQRINDAYAVLGDPERRSAYDASYRQYYGLDEQDDEDASAGESSKRVSTVSAIIGIIFIIRMLIRWNRIFDFF